MHQRPQDTFVLVLYLPYLIKEREHKPFTRHSQGILHSLACWDKNVAYHLDIHKQPDVDVTEPQHPVLYLLMFLHHFIWLTTSFPQITIPPL